jgi:Tfp pilus assembly protein PilN
VIEVNLLPAAGKGKKRGGARRSLALPSLQRLPGDRWVLGAGGLVLVGLLAIGWLFIGVAGKAEEVQVQIESAQRDSARFADVIRRSETLQARRDTIAQRVAALQQIDGARFVWPHLMDEVGRALPQGTWLTRFNQLAPAPNLSFRVEGNAVSYFALTNFMETLEGSPFVTGVRLVASDQRFVQIPGAGQQRVYNFVLDADYQEPPPEVIDREPLFGASVAIPLSDPAPAGDATSTDGNGEGS